MTHQRHPLNPAIFLILLIAASITPASAQTPSCEIPSSAGATYRLQFTQTWTGGSTFPTKFPGAGAHFTTIAGGVHSTKDVIWMNGETATPGVESVAEDGETSTLRSEVNALNSAKYFSGSGTEIRTLIVNQDCPLVSFISMLAPSHDWFVGVNSLDLRDGEGKFESKTMDVRVYDAGTEDGDNFSRSGTASNPPVAITRLTTAAADTDFSDGVHRTSGIFVGQFVFTLSTDNTQPPVTTPTATAPGKPTDLRVAKVTTPAEAGRTSLRLTWTAPTNTGSTAITGYRIERTEGATSTSFAQIGADIGDTTTYTDMNLKAGTTYRYRVSAINSAGAGAFSVIANGTTNDAVTLAEQAARLHKAATPEITRAITGYAVGAVARRVETAGVGEVGARGTLGGQSSLSGALRAHGRAVMDGSLRAKDLLGNSDFVVPLGVGERADNNPGDGATPASAAFWGRGEYRNLEGHTLDSNATRLNWNGNLRGAQLGVDRKTRAGVLLGVAVSWSKVELDYTNRSSKNTGKYAMDFVGINPYISHGGARGGWWATLGYGAGDLTVTTLGGMKISGVNAAVGGSAVLGRSAAATLRLKGETQQSKFTIDASDDLDADEVSSNLQRVSLQARRRHTGEGYFVDVSAELGARNDGGDGATGGGGELSFGLSWVAPGLTWETNARVLGGRDGYEEWGVDALIRKESGRDGQGFALVLAPGYGDASRGVQRVWGRDGLSSSNVARLGASLRYGLAARGGLGRFTPYGEATLAGGGNGYSVGVNWKLGETLTLDLIQKTTRQTARRGNVILLEGKLGF